MQEPCDKVTNPYLQGREPDAQDTMSEGHAIGE